jgi:hypothetical protein
MLRRDEITVLGLVGKGATTMVLGAALGYATLFTITLGACYFNYAKVIYLCDRERRLESSKLSLKVCSAKG